MLPFPGTEHWHYLHGKPKSSATLKAIPEHFKVNEVLPFEPVGEGEHLFLQIEKTGLNTGFVAQQLARFYGVKERDVGYAGRKDKHAVTTQWFSVWLPGVKSAPVKQFVYDGCNIKQQSWHSKKIRTGNLSHNEFQITLTDLEKDTDLEERIAKVKHTGVPNYFGPQRFGNINSDGVAGNLAMARLLINNETIKKREKRNMAVSALRSWLFNEAVSERLTKLSTTPENGDVFSLAGSNSFFVAETIDSEILTRLAGADIHLSAPLWGAGKPASLGVPGELENSLAERFPEICNTLAALGLKQERRKLLLYPKDFSYQLHEQQLLLNFSLPSGCFATSVIRELLCLNP
ncbi:tRNA pseudouridine(13) synthase TruD [Planctobacterium marinum]|uniref:tRNA pseudouridine synthase D n=1 Tax=Planctobacterium marinum TaxID=1631968 RepID=A0AA48KQY7_9ALTE|nr:tRNA pseudouridine synthase D [Planctobacterium marinum]